MGRLRGTSLVRLLEQLEALESRLVRLNSRVEENGTRIAAIEEQTAALARVRDSELSALQATAHKAEERHAKTADELEQLRRTSQYHLWRAAAPSAAPAPPIAVVGRAAATAVLLKKRFVAAVPAVGSRLSLTVSATAGALTVVMALAVIRRVRC